MALNSYTNLKSAIADWLNRTDLTTQIPDFITLAEAEMKRRLRRSSTRANLTISAYETTLPSDAAELRSIRLVSGDAYRDYPLRVGSKEMVDERNARGAGETGRPDTACIFGSKLLVAPQPDQSYTAEIVYFTQLTPLSDSVTTNTILTEAPDAYLFGALLQSAPFLEDEDRIPVWKQKFDDAIEQLNDVRTREEYGASFRAIRLPTVFTGP